MKPDKGLIKRSFSKAAPTYDANSELQKEVVEELVIYLEGYLSAGRSYARAANSQVLSTPAALTYQRILDAGCGTGRLASALKRADPSLSVYACDLSFPMAEKASENGVERVATADCESLPFKGSSFDMVASSLTYQWAGDLSLAFDEANRVLRPGGIFAFTTLGPKTLHEFRECYNKALGKTVPGVIAFQSEGLLSKELKGAGFEIESIESSVTVKRYDSLLALLRTLKNIGASPDVKGENKGLSKGSVLREAERIYKERYPFHEGDGIIATYEVVFAVAKKV